VAIKILHQAAVTLFLATATTPPDQGAPGPLASVASAVLAAQLLLALQDASAMPFIAFAPLQLAQAGLSATSATALLRRLPALPALCQLSHAIDDAMPMVIGFGSHSFWPPYDCGRSQALLRTALGLHLHLALALPVLVSYVTEQHANTRRAALEARRPLQPNQPGHCHQAVPTADGMGWTHLLASMTACLMLCDATAHVLMWLGAC
jgi:hypothetical protein